MTVPRANVGGVVRLSIALLATICMLVRAVLPVPAQAAGVPGAELRLLGATLCHFDEGTGGPDRAPAAPVSCDHCPLCAAAAHAPLEDPAAIVVPPPSSSPAAPRLAWSHRSSLPRAPPRLAHAPRAPPIG